MFDTILFDVDGTLTESGIGITRAVSYALEQFGIREEPGRLRHFIGPPLLHSFMASYGFSKEQAQEAVRAFRVYYSDRGVFESRVYDGIPALLQRLNEMGKHCVVATAKPEHYAMQVLEHFDLLKYFELVAAATLDESRNEKTGVIAWALEQLNRPDRTGIVMVGDRDNDVLGAARFGLPSIGVLWGYGSREELEGAGASWLAETVPDILNFI